MNDFTKAELMDLKNALQLAGDHCGFNLISLKSKVTVLINEYCEHRTECQVSDTDYVTVCKDCYKLTGWG